jgi:outer membrane murein-binding lipoprotein Lpp
MGSESHQDKIDELASTIDDMKITVDELAAGDPVPDADATNLDAIQSALDDASDAADDLVEHERGEDK